MGVLSDLTGALVPISVRRLQSEIEERIKKIPNELNEYGYDPYGMSPSWMAGSVLPALLLYRYYFRCEVFDVERVPSGRVLLIANHAGQLPFDGMMLTIAMLLEAEPPRVVRAMGEYWLPKLPGMSVAATRGGMLVGTPQNCIHMLENGECVLAFPEGVRGISKPFSKRYQLQRFGLGFMRLALETDTPIVPVAVVGSEEQQPGLANLPGLGRMLGMPSLPLTAGMLAAGPFLGMLPMPVKYRMYFGEPLAFTGDPSDEDASIQRKVDVVKRSIESMFERGLSERTGWFS